MHNTWIGIAIGLVTIGLLVFIGSGRTFSTPTPTPLVNPLIVATTSNNSSSTTTKTPEPEATIPRSAFNVPLIFNQGYQKVFIGGLIVTLTNLADSRCKPDVQCIWAGEISASFTIVGGGISPSQTITLGTATKRQIIVGAYLITLVTADESSATITVSNTGDTASTTPSLGTISGTVTIGPNCPVERVDEPCTTPPETYTSRSVIVYNAAGTTIISRKNLNLTGQFTLTLTPGTYQLQIDPAGIGLGEKKSVLVTKEETTTVTFAIDTGIR